MRVFYPISLDKQSNPISTLLREVAKNVVGIEFAGLSGVVTEGDAKEASQLWEFQHIHKLTPTEVLLKRFDVVHHASVTKHNLKLVAAAKLRSLGRVRHVYTANLQMNDDDPSLSKHEKAIKMADDVITVSEAVKADVERRFGVEVLRVIPNGYSAETYRHVVRRDTTRHADVPAEGGYLTYCGTLIARKRADLFLDVAEAMPNANFVVIGSRGWDVEKEFITRLESLPNVKNLGLLSRGDAARVLAHSSGLLFPSEREGLPLSVIEAMGLGVPVIAQSKSSLPELIRSKKDGFLVRGDSVEEWLTVARELMSWTEQQRDHFSEKLSTETAMRYSWQKVSAQYQDYYNSLKRH